MLTESQFIPELMELHRSGNFPIERLCKIYPFEKLETALADLKSGSVRWQQLLSIQSPWTDRAAGHRASYPILSK